jgi:hypothetical protein
MRTGDYSGVSFGFVMFGLLHTYFEYELQGDYDAWKDLMNYGPFLMLTIVATFFWLKKGFFGASVIENEKFSEKRGSSALAASDLAFPEFKCFNLAYIIMLLGIFLVCWICDAFVESKMVIMIMAFIPMLRLSQYLSQLIHIIYKRTIKGVSFLTALLMFSAPLLEAVAIWKYLEVCEQSFYLVFVFIFQNVPLIIISFLTVTA